MAYEGLDCVGREEYNIEEEGGAVANMNSKGK